MATAPPGEQDGRILPATHWASLVVFAILVPALVILWGMPDRTADAWAWTIQPDLTPIFLGAGYGAGAYFFLRTFLSDKFPPSSAGIFGAAFFAALMLIATLIHWDRFNHGDAPLIGALVFYGWVTVYIISPFVVFYLWWTNRRTDSGEPAPGEAIVPDWVRRIAQVVAVGSFVCAAFFFLAPNEAIDVWPWDLTPLTSRVIGSFTAQVGVGALMHLARPALGVMEADRADLLRGHRAALDRRDPGLGRLRHRQRADLLLSRRASCGRPRAAAAVPQHEPAGGGEAECRGMSS